MFGAWTHFPASLDKENDTIRIIGTEEQRKTKGKCKWTEQFWQNLLKAFFFKEQYLQTLIVPVD